MDQGYPVKPTDKLGRESQWSLDPATGVLTCQGDGGHDWLRWDRELGDFVFHVEWKFTPVTTGKKGYNSGIYVRNSADAKVWHQAQVGGGPDAFLFGETLGRRRAQAVQPLEAAGRQAGPAGRRVEHLRGDLQGEGRRPLGQRRGRQRVARLRGPPGVTSAWRPRATGSSSAT